MTITTTASSTSAAVTVGPMLRTWRQRRHLSQLDLANIAGVTTRHLSFVETGRSRPSREMVLHLAENLEVPLRDRNQLLIAAGFAPTFRESSLDDESFAGVRAALDQVLAGHEPYPAIVVDRGWHLVSSNVAAFVLVEDVAPALLVAPINVLRVSLHPDGLGSRIRNLDQWADHIIGRLRRQALITGDDGAHALADELEGYATTLGVARRPPNEAHEDVALPMLLDSRNGPLRLISRIATFGTALDITLADLALEAFLPGDASTSAILHEYADDRRG